MSPVVHDSSHPDPKHIRRRIFELPWGTPVDVAVLQALADHLDLPRIEPSLDTIGAMAGIGWRQAMRVLSKLEAKGVLVGEHRQEARKPTIWTFAGELLEPSPAPGRRDALEPKRRAIAEREKNKPEPKPEKTKARAARSVTKHLSGTPLMRYDPELRANVIVLADEVMAAAEEVLEDLRDELPNPRVNANAVEAKPQFKYASWAKSHTRKAEDDAT